MYFMSKRIKLKSDKNVSMMVGDYFLSIFNYL